MEVESTLIGHPAVFECAVVAKADESELMKPQAFVVLKEGYAPSAELEQELIQYCQEKMADYKRPRWVEFLDELPKTATGKSSVLSCELRENGRRRHKNILSNLRFFPLKIIQH